MQKQDSLFRTVLLEDSRHVAVPSQETLLLADLVRFRKQQPGFYELF